jgi:localization factor PodJL
MTGSVPWSVNAVDPEAWADARDAARRSGQSVGEWLELAIRNAVNDRHPPRTAAPQHFDTIERRLDEIAERLEHFSRQTREPAPAPARSGRGDAALLASIAALNERIDALSRDVRSDARNAPAEIRGAIQRLDDRIEHLLSRERIAGAGASPNLERKLESISRAIEAMSLRLEQAQAQPGLVSVPSTVDELDAAVAEIMMRQSVLDGVPPPRTMPRREAAPAAAPPLVPDLGSFERQLKLMTDEMQALRRSGMRAESIDGLRKEIAALAAKLGDLAPRHSLESLERSVETIALRLDRASGGRNDEALSEVVEALHDIRSALADVQPAESFASVEKDLRGISSKLDSLGGREIESNAVAQLQEQTAEIRNLLSGALPSDVLRALVEQIGMLVTKFEDRRAAPDNAILDVMSSLDRRIEDLSKRIERATHEVPASCALEEIRRRLDDMQDAVSRRDDSPSANIEAAVRALSEKIDATEARLGNLGSIERGLTDLFAQLEETRASVRDAAERAAKFAAREIAAPQPAPRSEPAVFEITRGAHGAMEARHSSGGNLRPEPSTAEPGKTLLPISPLPLRARDVADDIAPDYPLEPGSGAPRMRMQSAALRVAQSEAALGGIAEPAADAPVRTSDFIAAARRAAQAANAEPAEAPAKTAESPIRKGIGALLGRSRRALLVALAAFLLIFAALRFSDGSLPNPFRTGSPKPAPVTMAPKPAVPAAPAPVPANEGKAPAKQSNSDATEDTFVSAPPAGVLGDGRDLHFSNDAVAAPETTGSTTGQKPAGSIQTASAPAGVAATAEAGDALPAALGPLPLRAAAIAGDPIAAYEIGSRYLDGRGIRADTKEAAIWLERAHAKGSAPAAYRLGSIHEKGLNGRKNPAEALRYYALAAERGNIKAMHNLAVIYAEGANGKPDMRAAARWFRMAADRGVADSQYNVGVLYARGLGVEANLAESYRWFSLAANQGDVDAGKKRDDVAKRLDVQTLVAAKLAVQTWTPEPIEIAANEVRLKPEWEQAAAPARKRSVKK